MVLIVVGGMVGLVAVVATWEYLGLPGSIMWRARRATKRDGERRLRAPTADLLAEAQAAVRFEHWERFGPADALLRASTWSDEQLLRALEELFAAARDDDASKGRSGRDSNVFEFHDCGLAWIADALRTRTARRD